MLLDNIGILRILARFTPQVAFLKRVAACGIHAYSLPVPPTGKVLVAFPDALRLWRFVESAKGRLAGHDCWSSWSVTASEN